MSQVIMIDSAAKFEEVLEMFNNKLIVIDFFADWCGPCKLISPKFEKMVTEFSDVVFAKIDVDDEAVAEIITKYNIASMPTFVFIKNKNKIDVFTGANELKLREYVTKYQ